MGSLQDRHDAAMDAQFAFNAAKDSWKAVNDGLSEYRAGADDAHALYERSRLHDANVDEASVKLVGISLGDGAGDVEWEHELEQCRHDLGSGKFGPWDAVLADELGRLRDAMEVAEHADEDSYDVEWGY